VTTTVLGVDDDPTVLTALARLLRPEGVELLSATNASAALELLEARSESVAVVISDYSMPGMDGAEFLRLVGTRWPDITRVLLSGNADLPAAARAVNEGRVSRICTKPWQPDELRRAVAEAISQHQIVLENRRLRELADEQAARLESWNRRLEVEVSERTAELESANSTLQRSLLDTVRLLLTFLEQRLPERASMGKECARLAGRLAELAGLEPDIVGRVQVAALIHDIGLLGLPESLTRTSIVDLPPAGRLQYQRHPELAQKMLASVDQLSDIAVWVRHHHERWDGTGYPDRLVSTDIPMPSRIIALAEGFLEAAPPAPKAAAWVRLQRTAGAFDPDLLEILELELFGDGR
jgi:response regulator RpfG family c-di-GMP phosphodiesterase